MKNTAKNTAAVRKENINHIKQIIAGGGEYTVKTLTELTGLCAATCNSILKKLVAGGEVVGTPCQMNDVGRFTTVYKINPECGCVMYVRCAEEDGKNMVHITVLYLFGALRAFDDFECKDFSLKTLAEIIHQKKEQYKGLSGVLLAFAEGDMAELSAGLERLTGIRVKAMLNVEYFVRGIWSGRQGEVALSALPQEGGWNVYLSLNGSVVNGLSGKKQGALVEENNLVAMLAAACSLVCPDLICIVNAGESLRGKIESGLSSYDGETMFENNFTFRLIGGMNDFARLMALSTDDV